MKKPFLSLLAALLAAPFASAHELPGTLQDGLIFYLDFENRIEASQFQGEAAPRDFSGEAAYLKGVKGEAGHFGQEKMGTLRYSNEGNLEMAEGTLSFWVKPVNWQGSEEHVIPLFQQGVAQRGYLGINVSAFSGGQPTLRLFSQKVADRPDIVISGDSDWGDGLWRQIIVTWDSDAIRLYTDRGFVREAAIPRVYDAAEFDWPTFHIGNRLAETAIDEFRIWNRALTDDEIAQLREAEAPNP